MIMFGLKVRTGVLGIYAVQELSATCTYSNIVVDSIAEQRDYVTKALGEIFTFLPSKIPSEEKLRIFIKK